MKHEIQIHVAVTIMGDPLGISEAARKDTEICQFAVSYPPHLHGAILSQTVKESFEKLGLACLNKMRFAGLLRGGQ